MQNTGDFWPRVRWAPTCIAALSMAAVAGLGCQRSLRVRTTEVATPKGAGSAEPSHLRSGDPRSGAASEDGPAREGASARTLAREIVNASRDGWAAGGLTDGEVAVLERIAVPTLESLIAADYALYRATRTAQGAALNEAARLYAEREVATNRYAGVIPPEALGGTVDDRIGFLWGHADLREADWRSVDLELVIGGVGDDKLKPAGDEAFMGQGSFFDPENTGELSAAFTAGRAKVAWIQLGAFLGSNSYPTRLQIVFCHDAARSSWFPVWIYATPKANSYPRFMI